MTQLYCREDSDWTADRDLALSFPASAQALQFVHQHQLKDLEFVFTFGEPAYDLSIPAELTGPKPKRLLHPEPPCVSRSQLKAPTPPALK